MSSSSGVVSRTLQRAVERRRSLSNSPETTAFRFVHGEADGLAGVVVDWFGGVAIVGLYEGISTGDERALISSLADVLRPQSIYIKRKPASSHSASRDLTRYAPESPAYGEPIPEVVVSENGLRFLIRPPNGLSVGLYLDMRETRRWVRENARGARVLNCFAYTCGFGVAAIAGGAREVVNVDLSKRILNWGAENARLNGQSESVQRYVAEDVFRALKRLAKRRERFEMVILDPPSFSTSPKRAFSVARDYPALVAAAAPLCGRQATIVACCNQQSIPGAKFRRLLADGLKRTGQFFEFGEELSPSPVDFPRLGEPTLKVAIIRVRSMLMAEHGPG